MVYTINKFAWNRVKALMNFAKHGISFELATTAFDDPDSFGADDIEHSFHEKRYWFIGKANGDNLIVVIFTLRSSNQICRLISARRANRRERRLYEQNNHLPV